MALLSKKSGKKSESKIFNSHWLFTVYLALVSLVAVIVMSVNLGILITSVWKYVIITDGEYILSDRAWEVRQCSEPRWEESKQIPKTEEEITECEEKATVTALAQRSIGLKETFIESLAWFIVFGLLFWFHYPKFLRAREEK